MGLILEALLAGMYPAMAPKIIRTMVAAKAVPKSINGFFIKYSSKLKPTFFNTAIPKNRPTYPEIAVIKTDSWSTI
jgi:hypothetical protein